MTVCGRPQLPPHPDPKIQARREKARANAQEGRDKAKVRTTNAKAGSTIAGVIKRKLAMKPAKKEDTNRLHNLPDDIQKKIMGMANEKWDEDGISISTYKSNEGRKFFTTNLITAYTQKEDPNREVEEKDLDNALTNSKIGNQYNYRWSDNKSVKDINYKLEIENRKKKAIKIYKFKWNKNSRILILIIDQRDFYFVIPDITDLSKERDKNIYELTYGTEPAK